jgi:serine O-acetyltransferase
MAIFLMRIKELRMSFVADVRRDFRRALRMGARPADMALELATWIVFSYRVGRALGELPAPIRRACRLLHKPVHGVLQTLGGLELPVNASIGGGLHLRHTHGIVIHPEATVGKDCNISHEVTIGVGGRREDRGVPTLGDRVYVGPGAKIFGAVRVGDDAAIGANAVVNRDVAPHTVAAGVPARTVSIEGSAGLVVPGDAKPGPAMRQDPPLAKAA